MAYLLNDENNPVKQIDKLPKLTACASLKKYQ